MNDQFIASGGIVCLATAHAILEKRPGSRVAVL